MKIKDLFLKELPKLKKGYFYAIQENYNDLDDLCVVKELEKCPSCGKDLTAKNEIMCRKFFRWSDNVSDLIKFIKANPAAEKYLAKK